MGIRVIKKSEGIVRKVSENYSVTNLLAKDSSGNVSLAVSDATGHSETTKNTRSDRVYFVLEGKLVVKKDGEEFVAEAGDLIFIPKNTEYHFEGTFKTILINSPAFDMKDEEITKL